MSRLTPQHEGLYDVTCSKGHVSKVALQNMLFELLFEMGLWALAEGYTREAIADFKSAFERFQEFYFQLSATERGLDWQAIETTWKSVSAQSERQLGLYIGTYVADHHEAPPLLSNGREAFRNNVIHKGHIPTEGEALDFGQQVFDLIRPPVEALRKDRQDALQKVVLHHLQRQVGSSRTSTIVYPTAISLATGSEISVAQRVADIRAGRRI